MEVTPQLYVWSSRNVLVISLKVVTSILNGKYANALPLERQSKAFKCNGINLATNTMANWVIKSADLYLSLIFDLLHEKIYDYHIIHAYETPVKVMRIDNTKVRNGKKTYMWVYRNNPSQATTPIVLYAWQPSRTADHPRTFLKGFTGTVITDGYQVYHKLDAERTDLTVISAFCTNINHFLFSVSKRDLLHVVLYS